MNRSALTALTDDELRDLIRGHGTTGPYGDELWRRVPPLGALYAAYLAALEGDDDDYRAAHPGRAALPTVDVPATGASRRVGDLYRHALDTWLEGWQVCRHCEARIRQINADGADAMGASGADANGRHPEAGDWADLATGIDCPGTDDRRHEPSATAR